MGEVGSQTLGTFAIGENAVNTSVIAHSSVSQSTAGTTGNALQKKLTLGDFSVSEKSIGTPLTKSPSEVTSPTATVNASSTSESITSESTTSQAESNLFIGERTLGNESLGTALNSETSSIGVGISAQSVTASRIVEPTLEVIIIADVTTLATTSALASTASTETVAGETLTVALSGLTSGTDNATTAGALLSNTALIPRLSPSVSKSTGGSITGSTTKTTIADSISQAIDGLIANLSTVEKTGTGTTDTISNPEKGTASSNALISPTDNSVTAKAFESLLRVGGFVIGSTGFGDSLEAQNSVIGPLIAEGDSGITGVGKPSQSRTTAVLADSVSGGSGGITTGVQSVSSGGVPVTTTSSSVNLQTLAPTAILGSSADTFAVGGETITLNGSPLVSPVLSETLSDAVETTSGVSPIQSPVLSESLSESTLAAFSGSVKGGSVLSESIGGLIENIQSDPSISQADATTVSEALLQKPDIVTKTIDPNTETIGQGFRLLGLGSGVNVGEFEVGGGLTTQKAIGASTDTDSDAKATPEVQPTNSIGESLFSDSVSEGIGGTITPSSSETFLADSQSDSTGGVVQTLLGEAGIGIPFTETDSDGDLGTLVSGTVLASTADTEAVAGETVSLLFSPFDAIVDSRATSESLISTVNSAISLSESESFATANSIETLLSSFGVSSTVKTTSISDSVKSLSAGSSLEVNPFTETIGFAPPPIIRVGSEDVSGFKLGKSDRANQTINSSSIRVDADTASQSESEITASSLETLLSPSVSASSGGTITTVRSTIFLAQADTESVSDGTVATLVPATVLAATADTAASGGETLTLKLKPITVDPDTRSISDVPALTDISTAPQLDFGLAKSTSESSLILIESTTTTVNAFALTTALGRKIKSVYDLLTVDPETLAQAEPETTKSSIITILSQASTKSTAELSPKLINMIPLEGFRFLPSWTLNQRILGDTIDEIRNWNLIEITSRVEKETVVKDVRPLTPGVGAVDVISTSDGGYEVVKRGGSNEVTLEAATERKDVRPVETWYLQNISEEVIGSEGQQYEVTIEALPVREKAFDNSLGNLTSPFPDETRTQGFWKYEFEKGSIVTRRVTTDIEREPTNELKSVTVSFLAEPEEVRVMEENLSKLNAVAERDVPDGTNIVEDSTSDKRHIVDVTPPQDARDTVEAGEYYVTEWETEYQQSRAYIVQMNLVENEN